MGSDSLAFFGFLVFDPRLNSLRSGRCSCFVPFLLNWFFLAAFRGFLLIDCLANRFFNIKNWIGSNLSGCTGISTRGTRPFWLRLPSRSFCTKSFTLVVICPSFCAISFLRYVVIKFSRKRKTIGICSGTAWKPSSLAIFVFSCRCKLDFIRWRSIWAWRLMLFRFLVCGPCRIKCWFSCCLKYGQACIAGWLVF